MLQELVVTAVGPDRAGIASDFTGHVHAAGANLADSRMVNLRGHFARRWSLSSQSSCSTASGAKTVGT